MVAYRFLAEIEDMEKFGSAKKLIEYATLAPLVNQSAKWISYEGISKDCNIYLRNILYQVAKDMFSKIGCLVGC